MSFDPDSKTDGNTVHKDIRLGAMQDIQDVLLAREALHNSGYYIFKHDDLWVGHLPDGQLGAYPTLDEAKAYMRARGVDLTKVEVRDPDSQSGYYAAEYRR